jgi:nitroreductase
MTRRELLCGVGAGAAVVALQACAGGAACGASPGPADGGALAVLGAERERILALAARAPSGHNVQPWAVRVRGPDRWSVGADATRRLCAVDPTDRELVLSIGAFLECLTTAAAAHGLEAQIELRGRDPLSPELASVRLGPAPRRTGDADVLDRIQSRRTLRKHHLDRPLAPEDLGALLGALGSGARWFPRGTREAACLVDATSEAFRQQTWRDPAQAELAAWMRFSEEDARRRADGLTPAMLELGSVAGFVVRHFMDARSVTGKRFRDGGVDGTRELVRQGAGWLVLCSPDASVPALVEAGRRFARMALLLRERGLAVHPMSQVLEEEPWRSAIGGALGLGGVPQLVLRVGYVEDHPTPVSPRRPVGAFVTLAS